MYVTLYLQDSFVLRGVRNIKGLACIESFQISLTTLTDHQSQTHARNYGQSAQESGLLSQLVLVLCILAHWLQKTLTQACHTTS